MDTNFVFSTKEDAEKVLTALREDLSKAQIKKVEQGYLLELPPVEVILKENK